MHLFFEFTTNLPTLAWDPNFTMLTTVNYFIFSYGIVSNKTFSTRKRVPFDVYHGFEVKSKGQWMEKRYDSQQLSKHLLVQTQQ